MYRAKSICWIGVCALCACQGRIGEGPPETAETEETEEAAPVSWDGGGDGLHWSDPANWSPDAVPAAGDLEIEVAGARVIVDGDVVVAAGQRLAVTDAVLQIAREQTLTNRGELALSSGAIYTGDGAAFMNEGEVSGAGTVAHACSGAVGGAGQMASDVAVTDAPCSASCRTIEFSGLAAGATVTELRAAGVIGVSATAGAAGTPDRAIAFDSANPTGGDHDLATPGYGRGNDNPLGKLLIIAENEVDTDGDLLIDEPDDAACGGSIRFDFGCEVSIQAITLVDIEESGATVELEAFGNPVHSAEAAQLDDNSVQTLDLGGSPLATDLIVNLPSSGAVANLVVCTP